MDRAHGLLSCAAVAALPTGCLGSGTTRPTRLFVLNSTAALPVSAAETTDLRLGVGRISLPELLNRPQIVTRTGANEVLVADFSQWAVSAIAKRLGLPESKMYSIIEEYGNTSSASLPIALDHAHRQGVFGAGDLLLLGAIGGGLTWGTSIVRW